MSRINTTCERLKAINFFICRYLVFYEQLKFCAQYEKSFITSGPGFPHCTSNGYQPLESLKIYFFSVGNCNFGKIHNQQFDYFNPFHSGYW